MSRSNAAYPGREDLKQCDEDAEPEAVRRVNVKMRNGTKLKGFYRQAWGRIRLVPLI